MCQITTNKHTEVTMKATDLRIGNLVTDEFYDSFNTILKVESINEFGINLIIEDDGNYPEIASRWIEPELTFDKLRGIPLTEEWLLKFGLKSELNGYYYIDDFVISLDGYVYFGIEEKYIRSIEFVHDLQNLYYAIKGEELTYDPN